ncbi:MAG: ATP-binding cassette domain-containing protein [Lachnospiraceae bacterium]|nr:ATP-binding cassette domain-containing protein [Lachnospiraceae bacterium]
MIKTRLVKLLSRDRKYIVWQVLWQWLALLAQIAAVFTIAGLIEGKGSRTGAAAVFVAVLVIRAFCDRGAARASYRASVDVKRVLREQIYGKLLRLGVSYREHVSTSEVVQLCTDGVEQLETYFGKYLSQLFYSLLAPLTLFIVVEPISLRAAIVLLVFVPLIPLSIVVVQKIAKKLLNRYWDIYTGLGDSFLENLQGLTTLKIYQADGLKAEEMDAEAQEFRRITMKVLTMQLNSTSVMDIVAYGGAALGMVMAAGQYLQGALSLGQTVAIILLAIIRHEVFASLRRLCPAKLEGRDKGNLISILTSDIELLEVFYAHTISPTAALSSLSNNLNQTLASGERVLEILEEEPLVAEIPRPEEANVTEVGMRTAETGDKSVSPVSESRGTVAGCFTGAEAERVSFAYGEEEILHDCSLEIRPGQIVGIHGPSGSGKSTLLKLFMRFLDVNDGRVTISGRDVREIPTAELRDTESFVTQETHLFHDSIANNLAIGRPGATREEIMEAARKASIHDFILTLPQGYDTEVGELGDTLSGGERQRLGLARAFLHDAPFLLLDEPTSNLDALNEGAILKSLAEAGEHQTVVLVSHRRSTLRLADVVYEMDGGRRS